MSARLQMEDVIISVQMNQDMLSVHVEKGFSYHQIKHLVWVRILVLAQKIDYATFYQDIFLKNCSKCFDIQGETPSPPPTGPR